MGVGLGVGMLWCGLEFFVCWIVLCYLLCFFVLFHVCVVLVQMSSGVGVQRSLCWGSIGDAVRAVTGL